MSKIDDATATTRAVIDRVPPLDYVLDRELDIPGLSVSETFFEDYDDGVPNPRPGAWLVAFFLATVVIAVALIWRSWP
ncbi:hypothetical protein EN742_00755 [Mesorhizobium sp. M4A.F.Ca.ET.020.02.1.1]|uniref:hypothetical protein n=1 Tax=Mesorhizobium sp. M4A.F.Ca.ET.020.02.1.1 TaxID=2496652 RepID=UPI000FD25142|nr:hypothetical protein [Mesorhizobium sp. M4A.F.Ca.ET.020.02.1.1]RVD44908.1 hypothetical protein EN742_00755 [Mesorhizobium sp. M4A.F.Ca.ET.020.02.1.1]